MQLLTAFILFAVLFTASLLGTRALITLLTRRAVIDVPNERSSHVVPKPRGGGIAVVTVMLVGWIGWLALQGNLDVKSLLLAGLTAGLAVLSFIDDLKSLPARLRLLVQAAAVAAGLLVTVPDTGLSNGLIPVWIELPIAGFAWLWFVNLFNFMDGIDGITGIETISIGGGLLGLSVLGGIGAFIQLPALAMVAAIAGFLVWNWQPSKIFIGDVASIPLGFFAGWMLLETGAASDGSSGWAVVLLLPGYYLFDATFTLVKRGLRRENIFEAHRQHFYQQATQRGFSHAGACLAILALNIILITLALFVAPAYPVFSVLAGLVAVILLCLLFRRGGRKVEQAV
ncbi:MraY family glycosyltransferase [Nisaea denitrificans]|uniref:MraY family glycosyltransferase n=1 Tax=Nisaea denitrificans TaxID=390877 RepID=UPI0004212D4B|nr:glycosyltransferase family 4 protein [Nisaea denitrificans]